jgi:hypothetical protein
VAVSHSLGRSLRSAEADDPQPWFVVCPVLLDSSRDSNCDRRQRTHPIIRSCENLAVILPVLNFLKGMEVSLGLIQTLNWPPRIEMGLAGIEHLLLPEKQ